MSASTIVFYILAATTIGSALLAVTAQKIFRSAVYLLFSLIGIAGIYFYLNFEFIAAVQIVVYVGGIVVLIIFSIFLLFVFFGHIRLRCFLKEQVKSQVMLVLLIENVKRTDYSTVISSSPPS